MKNYSKLFKCFVWLVITCMAVMSFSGCGKKEEDGSLTTLKWYLPCNETSGREDVETELNKLLEKDGLQVELLYITQAEYTKKMQLINGAREEYDLCFTSNWLNDFNKNVSGGAFYDITDLVPEYAPETYASMKKEIWDGIKVDGVLYAVPSWQIFNKGVTMMSLDKHYEKTGMSPESIHTMQDVDKFVRKLHEVEPNANLFLNNWDVAMQNYGLLPVGATNLPGAVYYKADDCYKVVNQFETEDFKEYVSMVRGWVEDGVLYKDYLINADVTSMINAGTNFYAIRFGTCSPFAASQISTDKYNYEMSCLGEHVICTDGITAAMTAVSSTTKNPEAAVKLLEIVNTRPEVMNLICYGIEGKHYNKVSDNRIELIPNSDYTAPRSFFVGSSKNLYLTHQYEDGVWEETEEWNNTAEISPIFGFVPDTSPISGQLANCQNIIKEQIDVLVRGYVPVDEGIKKLNDSLKTAGVDEIIDEYQRQLDEWVSKK